MTQRFQDCIGKLYRPPGDGTRQVFALSRTDAEKLPRLASIAVISITAPDRRAADLNGFEYVLRLSFADVDFLNPNLSKRASEKLVHAFTEQQARAIRSFTIALPPKIVSIVVHCEGGYSRSCAIALGLHRLFGYRVETSHVAQANPSVVHLLTAKVPKEE
ncbi:hypothetical protein [Paraburkholderia sp. 32]|uniref:hypothetical protein n=1 Tax=Paraburkholderia sp. 32 TaxID=2991057 RepID=UPI003D20454C